MRTKRKFTKILLAIGIPALVVAVAVFAEDVVLQPAPGDSFVIQSSSEGEIFRVKDTGAVFAPDLPQGPTTGTALCHDPLTGEITRCPPGVVLGPAGPSGPSGPSGPAGPSGASCPGLESKIDVLDAKAEVIYDGVMTLDSKVDVIDFNLLNLESIILNPTVQSKVDELDESFLTLASLIENHDAVMESKIDLLLENQELIMSKIDVWVGPP